MSESELRYCVNCGPTTLEVVESSDGSTDKVCTRCVEQYGR